MAQEFWFSLPLLGLIFLLFSPASGVHQSTRPEASPYRARGELPDGGTGSLPVDDDKLLTTNQLLALSCSSLDWIPPTQLDFSCFFSSLVLPSSICPPLAAHHAHISGRPGVSGIRDRWISLSTATQPRSLQIGPALSGSLFSERACVICFAIRQSTSPRRSFSLGLARS